MREVALTEKKTHGSWNRKGCSLRFGRGLLLVSACSFLQLQVRNFFYSILIEINSSNNNVFRRVI